MLTRISKILAVVMAVISVAVLSAVAVATLVGGPNWDAQARATTEYSFTPSDDPQNKTFTPTSRSEKRGADGKLARKSLSAKPLLAEAIYDARKDLQKEQQDELDQLGKDVEDTKGKIERAKALIAMDVEAIKKRETSLLAERDALHAEIEKTRQETIAKSEEVKTVNDEIEKRRNDVFRLQNELSALRADKYRMLDQQKKLADLLIRIEENIGTLERREKQLVDSGATVKGPAVKGPANGKPASEKPAEKPAE